MIWHSSTTSDIIDKLETSAENGMTTDKINYKLQKYGKNLITEKKRKSLFQRFLAQLKDAMVIILIIAAVVSVVITMIEGSGAKGIEPKDWIEPIVIVAIVLLNAFLGVFQESKAEAALEALKNMATPNAKVIRNGKHEIIDASLLVPGDIIIFDAGDYIPADARLLEAYSLRCDESMLTGESVAVEKNAGEICEDIAPIGDRLNMVFSGCSVSYGHGKAVVTETGMYTEMGKIAAMLKDTNDTITPLQIKLASLGKNLGFIALAICVLIFIYGSIKGLGTLEMFMTAVSLAVAAIPEGLPAIVTIVLALGVQRMVKKNAIIRRLPAVETLGNASVICSDKTGTLTQNRMSLVKAYTAGKLSDVYEIFSDDVANLLKLGALCCDGNIEINDGKEVAIGDPTETAIVAAAMRALSTDKATLDMTYPRMCEIPFDSDRKLMTTVVVIDSKPFAIVKGGADIILERCNSFDKESAQNANDEMANEALRVLGIAIKPLDEIPSNPTINELEYNLTFVGLVGMMDPPRKEAADALKECKTAGIKTVVITGDHVITAAAIAQKLNIMGENDLAITGAQLNEMTDDELDEKLEHIRVYARVAPEDKIRIVQAWQRKGEVVAMTGDGVNDAPALKAADIGCAMGVTGTDVAKGASEMTLTDDNFATIVTAVKEGRGIYNNIRKAILFLLSCNLGEIIAVFSCMLIFTKSLLTPILLLWVNLVTDSLPALALGVEPVDKNVMREKPRRKNENIFSRGLGINALWQGVMFGILTITAYIIGLQHQGWSFGSPVADAYVDYAHTMAFIVLAFAQLVHAMNCRSEQSLFSAGFFKNRFMLLSVAISALLILAVVFIPVLREIFGLTLLSSDSIFEVVLLALSPLVISEIVKFGKLIYKKASR